MNIFLCGFRANRNGKIVPEIKSNDTRAKCPNICSMKTTKELFRRDITRSIAIVVQITVSCLQSRPFFVLNYDNLFSLRLEIIDAAKLVFILLWRMSHASGLLVQNVFFRAVHAER